MLSILEKSTATKKYFVKDESLHSVDGDMFNYSDIAQVLDDIISTNTPPYNVAVIGKWGLGKSSLINLVTEKFRKDPNHYLVQEINAWKYEKESLRKVFLKQLQERVSNQRIRSFETIRKEIYDIVREEIPVDNTAGNKARTRKFWLTLFAITVATALAFIIYKIVQALVSGTSIMTLDFWTHVFLRYCKNISTVLVGPALVALCKLVFDDYHAKQSKKIELNFPIETTDDYEIFLETRIKEQLKKNPDLKIITVIDDLDRLSIDKIVEALDALKAFVGFERCIFIVPFDDEIIKRALDKRRAQDFNEQAEVIESELILDKLFQFKVYLPPILDFDIQQYACNLAKQEVPDFLMQYCDEQTMQKVIERILIYPGVTTPRQVKKLLNSFINNFMIVAARESSGRIQKGLLTSDDGIMQIAKMSVLQADFNNFYDLLFRDMRCINFILEAHRGDLAVADLPVYLRCYFEDENDSSKIKSEYETLINFLIKTEKYRVASIAPYLYLAQDEISIRTGDELQRRAMNALQSGNVRTLKNLLSESSDLADLISYQLSRETSEVTDILSTAMCAFESVDNSHKANVAQSIIERTSELSLTECKFLYYIPAENVFQIAQHGENKKFNADYVQKYLCTLGEDGWFEGVYLCRALTVIFANHRILDAPSKSKLKDICNLCIEKDSLSAVSLFDLVNPQSDEFMQYWGFPWFKKLCDYIDKENDFSTVVSEQAVGAFKVLYRNMSLDELTQPMIKLTQYSAFLPILSTICNIKSDNSSGVKIKTVLGHNTATQIAENVIAHDFNEYDESICSIMNGLQFEITEENCNQLDKFTLNYAISSLIDDILEYCGKCNYFTLLPKTIDALTTSAFQDDENDELLVKVVQYFTSSQVSAFGKKLLDASGVSSSKKYERELSLFKIISPYNIWGSELVKIVERQMLPNLSSYQHYDNYREFVSQAIGYIKDALPQETIDNYTQVINSRFASYRQFSLTAIDRITMKMSESAFKSVFEKIASSSEQADFELALDVIINHNEIRPRDDTNLTRYVSFLVTNLATTANPHRVLNTLRRSFSKISMLQEMSTNALKNPDCTAGELSKTIAHFINNIESIEKVTSSLVALSNSGITATIISQVIAKLEQHNLDEIYTHFSSEILDMSDPASLLTLVDTACNDIRNESARSFILNCLLKSFEKQNLSECSIKILEKIKQYESTFKLQKDNLATVLRAGFTSTTSDSLKKAILMVVSSFKIKPQFKKTLSGEDMEYYKKWTS